LQIKTSNDQLPFIFYLLYHFIDGDGSHKHLNRSMESMVLQSLLYFHQRAITNAYYLLLTSIVYRNGFDTLNAIKDILIYFLCNFPIACFQPQSVYIYKFCYCKR
jgi:hypothetical protein